MKAQAAIELIAIAGLWISLGSARRPDGRVASGARQRRQYPSQTTKLKRISVFKNMIVYRIAPGWQADLVQVEEALAKAFHGVQGHPGKIAGLVPPRGEQHGALAESVGGQWILRFMVESKVLPGSVLNRRVKERPPASSRKPAASPAEGKARNSGRSQAGLVAHGFHQAGQHVGVD